MTTIKWNKMSEKQPEFIKYTLTKKDSKTGEIKTFEKERDYSKQCLLIFEGKVRYASWCSECIGAEVNRCNKWNFLTKTQSNQVEYWTYLDDIVVEV